MGLSNSLMRVLMSLERALYAGDADLVIGANNKIQEGLGQKALSNNK